MTNTIFIIIIAILLIVITVLLLLIKKGKKTTIQVVGDFLVFNENGVEADKIQQGDMILGKYDDAFIIADVETLKPVFKAGLGVYLSNTKIK